MNSITHGFGFISIVSSLVLSSIRQKYAYRKNNVLEKISGPIIYKTKKINKKIYIPLFQKSFYEQVYYIKIGNKEYTNIGKFKHNLPTKLKNEEYTYELELTDNIYVDLYKNINNDIYLFNKIQDYDDIVQLMYMYFIFISILYLITITIIITSSQIDYYFMNNVYN